MGERKVLNKYYPPDFNPSKLPRLRRHKNRQIKVRMMLPMSIRCNTCGNYIYKGTKFNSRKEDTGETYLGKIQIFRFYFKCTRCSAELTIKTDPQNSDYVVESGATRNFEPWRAEDEEAGKKKRKREAEEMGNSMKSLENRTLDSKREMDKIAVLRELKSMKSRQAAVNVDAMLEASQRAAAERQRRLDEEDEALIKSIFSKPKVRRIADEELDDECESSRLQKNRNKVTSTNPTDIQVSSRDNRSNPRKSSNNLPVRILVIKKQATSSSSSPTNQTAAKSEEAKPPEERRTVATNTGLPSICKNYSSDNDDEE